MAIKERELARLSVAAPIDGTTWVLVSKQGGLIRYRRFESWPGAADAGDASAGGAGRVRSERECTEPMTLDELAEFVLDGGLFDQPSFSDLLLKHFGDDRNAAMRSVDVRCRDYPGFEPLCRDRIREVFADGRAGDECPFCGDFNSPPAEDHCAHAAGWTWDGNFEPLGSGVALAQAIDELNELEGRGSDDARVLASLAGKGSLRRRLLGKARKGVDAVLLGLAKAQAGQGWTTGGMLSGGGSTLYVPDPARLDFLAAEGATLVQACRMAIRTDDGGGSLERLRPAKPLDWTPITSGFWSDSPYHGGHIAYGVGRAGPGEWLLESVERNTCLDDVTDAEMDAGALNDDQLQALHGMTLAEAQASEYRLIAAACSDAPEGLTPMEVGDILYRAVCRDGGKAIDEPDAGD